MAKKKPKKKASGKKKKKSSSSGDKKKTLVVQPKRALAKKGASQFAGRGFENLERKDILIPRMKLLQANSPEVEGDLAQDKGTIFTIPANKNFGDKVLITPILHFRSRIKWEGDRADGDGEIECQSDDGRNPKKNIFEVSPDEDGNICPNCPKKEWDNEEEGKDAIPECTLYENFVVLIGNEDNPVILPMERTKAKAARKFYSMGALKNQDFWNFQYELKIVKEKNPEGKHYYNFVISDIGKETNAERRTLCENLYESLADKTLTPAELKPEDGESAGGIGAKPNSSRDL